MNGNGFDSIAQAILSQKQMMDKLQQENRELRRQIADLQAGHGIFIEVAGMRFPILGEIAAPASTTPSDVVQQEFSASPTAYFLAEEQVSSEIENEDTPKTVELAPAQELSPLKDDSAEPEEQEKVPTFLEEIMIDEFATASTSPMTAWGGSDKKTQPEQIDEEQKAALRRELMGSFLLE